MIDLFCGAGGMSLGFHRAGFRQVLAIDMDPASIATYRANFGDHARVADIVKLVEGAFDSIPRADIVIGGPPCQGFSLLNKKKVGDARRQLWRPYLDVVRASGAKAFVMENVPQLLDSDEFEEILFEAKQLGFTVASAKLLAADYGVPQRRTRAFVVGVLEGDPSNVFPPPPTHESPHRSIANLFDALPDRLPWRTVRDAIGELPPPVGTGIRAEPSPLDLHFGRTPTETSMARYRAIPEQGMNREDLLRRAPQLTPKCWIDKKGGTDLMGRLWWDRPAFTIRTEFFKPEKGRYLHPEQHRPITHREAARLQSFPDSFIFCGTKIEIARQIGNAVPPLLAEAVAKSVAQLVQSEVSL